MPLLLDPHTFSLHNDALGKSAQSAYDRLAAAPSWDSFVDGWCGRPYIKESVGTIPHPSAPFLNHLHNQGVPVETVDGNWTQAERDTCFQHGPHASGQQHSAFVHEEMAEFADTGYWVVLPYSAIKHMENLKPSPLSVKVKRDCKDRILCNHTWFGINANTVPFTP